ncbi:hypothetical protein [Streptomyces sp. NPDC007205]|uniref:hypothetical protein n=1 Tax=Streptomyces sp. NPDC007205 TaxID=3154316 RepID=UPI0033F21147
MAAVLTAAGIAVGSLVLWGSPQATAAVNSCDGPDRVDGPPPTGSSTCAPVDLAIAENGPAFARQGDPVEYKIVVANFGPDTSSGWTVKDPSLPKALVRPRASTPDCSITGRTLTCHGSSLEKGHSTAITVTGVAGPESERFTDSVAVNGNESDPDLSNNVSSASTNIAPSSKVRAQPRTDRAVKSKGGHAHHGKRSTRSSSRSKYGSTTRTHRPAHRAGKH